MGPSARPPTQLHLHQTKMGKWGQGFGSSGCPVCLRSVFPMEAVMAADRTPYHKYCLKCNECGRKLEIANLNEHEKSLYCSSCYQVLFRAHSDILVNDSRKMQVLPVAGKYDKKETDNLRNLRVLYWTQPSTLLHRPRWLPLEDNQ